MSPRSTSLSRSKARQERRLVIAATTLSGSLTTAVTLDVFNGNSSEG
jgi:hypothetical protein